MKVVLVFACFAAVFVRLAIGSQAPYLSQIREFMQFKGKYNKTYPSAPEEFQAIKRFIAVLARINAWNLEFEKDNKTSEMGINRFADLTPAQLAIVLSGNIIPNRDFTDVLVRPRAIVTAKPGMFPTGPPSWDWNAQGHVTPVKDQGYFCSCCWAFSGVAALECALSIKYGNLTTLSEQYLIDCNRNNDTGNWGCNGGSQASAYMNVQYAPGIPSSDTYPYAEVEADPPIRKCRYNQKTSVGVTTGYGRIQPLNETLLKDVIAAQGPVSAALNAEVDSFLFYKSGILNDDSCVPGTGHAILIYGYGTATRKSGLQIDYWLCKNSWSTSWGDNGYFKIIRGKNMCGITGYLIYPYV